MTELKPCPFCGSGWLYETWKDGYYIETPTLFCNSCKASVTWEQIEDEGVNDETKTFVREHWNSRAERTCRMKYSGGTPEFASLDTWTCSECGYEMYDIAEPNYCPNCGCKVVGE